MVTLVNQHLRQNQIRPYFTRQKNYDSNVIQRPISSNATLIALSEAGEPLQHCQVENEKKMKEMKRSLAYLGYVEYT